MKIIIIFIVFISCEIPVSADEEINKFKTDIGFVNTESFTKDNSLYLRVYYSHAKFLNITNMTIGSNGISGVYNTKGNYSSFILSGSILEHAIENRKNQNSVVFKYSNGVAVGVGISENMKVILNHHY